MISRFTRLARKLRGRDPAELRERGAQALAAWRERSGLAAGELAVDAAALAGRLRPDVPADPAALLAAFRGRAPAFMPVFDDPAATVAALAARCPADRADVLAHAARVLAGQFDLLGYESLSYGDPVDWQRDPVRGLRAPHAAHWSRVPYLDAAAVGDHKVTWEVNRQQYLVTLGQAYWYTGDARYADAFAAHVTAWMDANPPKRGINWASALEVAFRAMSWVWALHYFRASPALTPALYARLLAYLHVHARHLERYLSTYFSPNTHLTGEALGLVHVGALVPELAGAARWRQRGLSVLAEWLPRQVRADGGYFEQATQYHRYTTEFALHLLLLDQRHGWGLDAWLRPMLGRLAEYLQAVARPDGTIPLVGDDDGGKLVFLDGRPPDDVRGVLAQAAAVLGSPEFAGSAGDSAASLPATLWLLGADGGNQLDALSPAAPTSLFRVFPQTGVYVLRDGWGPDSAHAVLDCGPHGAFNGGHAHADLLAITASANGRPLLVDRGTYSYPGPERNAFRGAAAHNVVLVDGEGSSTPSDDPFQWRVTTDGRVLTWQVEDGVTYFEGAHDGFLRLPDPVAYRRAVVFVPGLGWIVRDRLGAAAEHTVRAHWHLAPGLAAEADGPGGMLVRDPDGRAALRVIAFGRNGAAALAAEPAWVSPRYGKRVAATRLAFEQRAAGAQDVVTFLLLPPHGGTGTPPAVTETACADGRAFTVHAPEPVHVHLRAAGAPVVTRDAPASPSPGAAP